jgi:hypothetical protein
VSLLLRNQIAGPPVLCRLPVLRGIACLRLGGRGTYSGSVGVVDLLVYTRGNFLLGF